MDEFQSLLAQVRDGSDDAARQLYEAYGRHVMLVVRRNLAKNLRSKFDSLDFAQAVWASFFAEREKIVDLAGPESLINYLAVVARNKVVSEYRRRNGTQQYDVRREHGLPQAAPDEAPDVIGRSPTPSQVAVANELWVTMFENLPEREREILRLRWQGWNNEQVAEHFGLNEKTIRRIITQIFEGVVQA